MAKAATDPKPSDTVVETHDPRVVVPAKREPETDTRTSFLAWNPPLAANSQAGF